MLIEYKNVNIYQQDTMVLSNVDFHVDEGEFIYIIGKVGSGKSSLLKTTYCELDLYQDEADKAEILGRNLLKLRRKDIPSLRKEMGIIFQDFQLLHDRTVYQNLLFVLKATGWKDKEKIKTRISEVLALLNQPKVIIADEPTGNLDPETASSILQLLKDITATGTAIVMTTHNIPLIDKYPGIVYKCQDGKITDITKDYSHMCLEEE